MSASPAPASSGPNSTTPNTGGPAPVARRKAPKASIFTTKKPVRKAAPAKPQPSQGSSAAQPAARASAPSTAQQQQNQPPEDDPSTYEEYPIYISKSSLEEGLRHHALKLRSRVDESGKPMTVDPYDESQFTRPLHLHRRFARDKMETGEQPETDGVDDKERELLNARRAERQAEREENQKLIAPTTVDSNKATKKKNQKKVEEGRDDSNPVRQKRQQLRYEEARPWHLEDFESKNVWVGSYEEALSESSIMLEVSGAGFRMIPIEKWYQFVQTGKVTSDLTSEDIEKLMSKKVRVDRWGMGTQKGNDEARRQEHIRRIQERRAREDDDDEPLFNDRADFDADRDMLDMDWKDEFQDDDEGVLIQGEEGEDEKEIEQKLWMEMREAGLGGTGVKEEDLDPEEEERRKQIAEEEEKKKARRLRKQLKKREHRGEYESDSDDFDSDTDEEEESEEKKKEEAAKAAALQNGDKSGASTRGTNTPSGRPEKRPNPDLSDASGNESSRKRAKLNGSTTQGKSHGGARSLSPDAARAKHRSGAGSGSGSDTDTSRAGRPKLKLKKSPSGSPSGNTPNGSRAASPSATGSRAQSPNGAAKPGFPTLEEVRAAIPPSGIEIKALVGLFKSKVGQRTAEFIALVKSAGMQDKSTPGRILPKA